MILVQAAHQGQGLADEHDWAREQLTQQVLEQAAKHLVLTLDIEPAHTMAHTLFGIEPVATRQYKLSTLVPTAAFWADLANALRPGASNETREAALLRLHGHLIEYENLVKHDARDPELQRG